MSRRFSPARWQELWFGAALLSSTGCVSRDAGYQDVQKLVRSRTGHDVQWQRMSGSSASQKKTLELLSRPLTADGAVQIALLNNPGLQATFEELGVARADLVTALALPNPNAEARFGFRPGGGEPDVDLAVTESISQLFFMPLRNSAASASLDAAKMSVGIAALDLALETRTSFYAHQAAEQILELRRTVLKAARASFEAARLMAEAGNVTALDLANEQALYEEARLGTAQAETALFRSRERMNALMGLWGRGIGWKTVGRLPEPAQREHDLDRAEPNAVARSIDLELTRRRFTAARQRVNVARAVGIVPELRAGVGAEREQGDWRWGPVVELELPLFYQGQGQAAGSEAEANRQQKLNRAVAINVRAQTRSLVNQVLSTRERVTHYRLVLLPLRARIVAETELHFNAMEVSLFQLLQAKKEQVETGRAYVETLRDYWIARAELDQLLSGRLVRGGSEMFGSEPSPSSESADAEHH